RRTKSTLLMPWELDELSPASREELIRDKQKDWKSRLEFLIDLRNRAIRSPVFLGSHNDVPSEILRDELLHPSPLDGRPWFSYVLYHDCLYEVSGPYTEQEFVLLVLEEFDRERKRFEKLHALYVEPDNADPVIQHERIPEKVRIYVWRRDGGKCARCGGRERLEYDHIVPRSRGGSNTARNVELLCESCNRNKSDRIQ
ncbi:MAG: HNH endonuclease, partial [Kiritimatiellae bacterium]|nr:HNH endonuclease [Kiritimatiellia bacterium]